MNIEIDPRDSKIAEYLEGMSFLLYPMSLTESICHAFASEVQQVVIGGTVKILGLSLPPSAKWPDDGSDLAGIEIEEIDDNDAAQLHLQNLVLAEQLVLQTVLHLIEGDEAKAKEVHDEIASDSFTQDNQPWDFDKIKSHIDQINLKNQPPKDAPTQPGRSQTLRLGLTSTAELDDIEPDPPDVKKAVVEEQTDVMDLLNKEFLIEQWQYFVNLFQSRGMSGGMFVIGVLFAFMVYLYPKGMLSLIGFLIVGILVYMLRTQKSVVSGLITGSVLLLIVLYGGDIVRMVPVPSFGSATALVHKDRAADETVPPSDANQPEVPVEQSTSTPAPAPKQVADRPNKPVIALATEAERVCMPKLVMYNEKLGMAEFRLVNADCTDPGITLMVLGLQPEDKPADVLNNGVLKGCFKGHRGHHSATATCPAFQLRY